MNYLSKNKSIYFIISRGRLCGGGNCPLWIVLKTKTGFHIILEAVSGPNALYVVPRWHNGFLDIAFSDNKQHPLIFNGREYEFEE